MALTALCVPFTWARSICRPVCLLTRHIERSPARVLGDLPTQQGAQGGDSREADHHIAHEMDAQGTGRVRLGRSTELHYWRVQASLWSQSEATM